MTQHLSSYAPQRTTTALVLRAIESARRSPQRPEVAEWKLCVKAKGEVLASTTLGSYDQVMFLRHELGKLGFAMRVLSEHQQCDFLFEAVGDELPI